MTELASYLGGAFLSLAQTMKELCLINLIYFSTFIKANLALKKTSYNLSFLNEELFVSYESKKLWGQGFYFSKSRNYSIFAMAKNLRDISSKYLLK